MDCEHWTIRNGNVVIRDGDMILCEDPPSDAVDLVGVIETRLDGLIQQPIMKGVIR